MVQVPRPSPTEFRLSDPKWCRKNVRDVDAVRYFALHGSHKHVVEGRNMAQSVIDRRFRADSGQLLQPLTDAFSLGLAYAREQLTSGKAMRREEWEALCFSAGRDTAREPKTHVGLFPCAVFVGDFVARHSDERSLVDTFDWVRAKAHSLRVEVVQDMVRLAWAAMKPAHP